jgi:hypothetical protein
MATTVIETDYLIIGAGATAMAFADTLLDESDASIVMVDRHHRPGGHWNEAYPFVRLHQPSASYGVNSRELSRGLKDSAGLNQGLSELASGAEVVAYFENVMHQRFLPSGRVRYFPMCNYEGGQGPEQAFTSRLSGERHTVRVQKKVVDATHARTEVPFTHPPKYVVAPGLRCIPLNALPNIERPPAGYVVVGSGKTGIDACLWLLENGVSPDDIRWIMPRDAWFLDRANVQPGQEFFEATIGGLVKQFECILAASSIPDLFGRLEAAGQLLRIDRSVEPTVYHCATVTRAELRELQRIRSIVRLGRVQSIEPTRIKLEMGDVQTDPDCVYVDCSAKGLQPPPDMPIFDGARINLLTVRTCQPTFSAALIAYVESHLTDPAEKNAFCRVVPHPQVPRDWIRMWSVLLDNRSCWNQHEGLFGWLKRTRLDYVTRLVVEASEDDPKKQALLNRYRSSVGLVTSKLRELMKATG